jgi:hypothetical protein
MTVPDLALEINEKVLGDARWAIIERIASSPHLKTSARLRDFLFYVADCAIRDAPEEATEQQIGIHVFQRHPGYNSSEDSIVRTHARLLRQKLALYFAEEGAGEPMVVDIPKGHYLPDFHPRTEAEPAAVVELLAPPAAVVEPAPPMVATRHFAPGWKWLLLLIPVLMTCGLLIWRPWIKPVVSQAPVEKFWKPFLVEDPPLVIFSNALFLGDSTHGLRYAPAQDQKSASAEDTEDTYVDTYTGIGELSAVYTLTRLFDAHQARFILKRSLLMTWDEAASKNLVFIGSVAENLSLRVLESTRDFTMTTGPGYAGLVNHHPKAGEPAIYSRPERPLTKDYAILALLPGVQPGKRMLVFSGLTTFGTQAAVDYVCRPESVAELLRQITGPKGEIRPFEAVLETTIGGGVPLQTRLVTLRVH